MLPLPDTMLASPSQLSCPSIVSFFWVLYDASTAKITLFYSFGAVVYYGIENPELTTPRILKEDR